MLPLQRYFGGSIMWPRLATREDLRFIQDLRLNLMGPQAQGICWWVDEYQEEWVESHYDPSNVWILTLSEEDIGSIGIFPDGGSLHVKMFYIKPDLQGRGLGSGVMQSVAEMADGLQMPLRLSVVRNSPARRLYERFGFTLDGEGPRSTFLSRKPRRLIPS